MCELRHDHGDGAGGAAMRVAVCEADTAESGRAELKACLTELREAVGDAM